jgi:hypothetical protein
VRSSYEIVGVEVIDSIRVAKQAALSIGFKDKVDEQIAAILLRDGAMVQWMRKFASMAAHPPIRIPPAM